MKKILILVLSSDFQPYSKMITTSLATWDNIEAPGTETIFYCSQKDNPNFKQSAKILYFPVDNSLYDMGHKNLAMFEWALKNREFDYVCRLNASQYCDKKELIKYVQSLPDENVFCGVKVDETPAWCWGGAGYILSKDVIQKIVDEKDYWAHTQMEDRAMSYLVERLGIPITPGIPSCSIDQKEAAWQCTSYCGKGITFSDFNDLKELGHIIYRVKQDGQRWVDEMIMHRLFEALNPQTGENKEPTNY